jgi:hypothetical protein
VIGSCPLKNHWQSPLPLVMVENTLVMAVFSVDFTGVQLLGPQMEVLGSFELSKTLQFWIV